MAKAKDNLAGGVPPEGGAPAGGDPPPPPFGTPVPLDAGGPVPRVVRELERAPRGFARFKIRCANYAPQPVKYVLAADREAAEAHYLDATRLGERVAKLKKQAGAKAAEVEAPDLVVTELAD